MVYTSKYRKQKIKIGRGIAFLVLFLEDFRIGAILLKKVGLKWGSFPLIKLNNMQHFLHFHFFVECLLSKRP